MLRLRVAVDEPTRIKLAESLSDMEGVHRVTVASDSLKADHCEWVVSADLSAAAADKVLELFHDLDIPHHDYVIVRQDVIAPGIGSRPSVSGEGGFAWVEIVGEARAHARPVARYVLLMMVAGVIAGLGVLTDNSILIIGAMAVSPDLLPLCATSVGLVGGRYHLASRAFATLTIGMGLVALVALLMTAVLLLVGLVPSTVNVDLPDLRGLASPDYKTVLIAAAAGVAAILSFETRAANAVGVAISVTTVPASGLFGVSIALGEFDRAGGALAVLFINLIVLVATGTITLLVQRRYTPH